MDPQTVLLAALVILLAGRIYQAHLHHQESLRMFNDYATMVGELFDVLRERKEG